MKNIVIAFIIILILTSCAKNTNKIKFIKWEESIVDAKANIIASNSIRGFKKGVFASPNTIDT